MTRPKQDNELRLIATILNALDAVPEGRRAAVLEYVNDRMLPEPMVILPDGQAPWASELGEEREPD